MEHIAHGMVEGRGASKQIITQIITVVIDAGHNEYATRYLICTLVCIVRTLSKLTVNLILKLSRHLRF